MTTSRKNPRSWGDDYTPTTKGQHTMAHDAAYSECLASFPEGIRKTTAESGIYTDSLGGKWEVC